MPIVFHENTKVFHLYNEYISYIFMILKNGQLGQLYYGKVIHDREDFSYLLELIKRPMSVCTFDDDDTFSLEHIKQEYPSYGTGDMRYPAFTILQKNGSQITNFKYLSHSIIKGKPTLEGLPATYVETIQEALTLKIILKDDVMNTKIILSYTIYQHRPVICRNVCFEHVGTEDIMLQNAMSMSIDVPTDDFEMITLTGAWARERSVKVQPLHEGIQSIYSLRGCSSNIFNPFIALKSKGADENSGEVYGFSLVYSGNFLAQVEVDTYHVTRIMMGIHPHCFSWTMHSGDCFQTPEVVMVYSDSGINAMSRTYHALYQKRLARGKYRDQVRPILINNWEATYFKFNEKKILELAKTAKRLGIELFVLDDGWFFKRNNTRTGLGDWYPDTKKLPDGIAGLAKKITDMGLLFGLWFEPEMVNKDSNLYRSHPEWVLQTPNRHASTGRHQYVLDFSNSEVIDYIFTLMDNILSTASISYIKWDMNRCMSEVYSCKHTASNQGKVMHEYMLGVYRLYERLITRYPDVLFESCASGGARFDPGMLYYAPQCWTSDDTDAIERLKIQYGTSFVYPISSMGSHVSSIPNHQLLRNTPLSTRGNVAYFGTFGYELDINALTKEEQEEIKKQIVFMKEYREVIQYGTFYRLQSPFTDNVTVWMVVSPDKKIALVGYYRVLQVVNAGYERIRLQGLDPQMNYHVSIENREHYGDELMQVGLLTSDASSGQNNEKYNGHNGDFQSRIYILKAKG